MDLNAYNDVSTDEEALEEAIKEEAIRMQPKPKRLTGLEQHQRNVLMATKSEPEVSIEAPLVRRLFNLKSLRE